MQHRAARIQHRAASQRIAQRGVSSRQNVWAHLGRRGGGGHLWKMYCGAAWPAGAPGHCWECCWLNTLIRSVSHRIAKSNTEGKDHVTSQIHILRQNRLYRKVYDGPWILGPRLLGGAAGG